MSTLPAPRTTSQLADADMRATSAALLRAAQRAREIARRTDTAVVVMREGKLVEERVPPATSAGQGTKIG